MSKIQVIHSASRDGWNTRQDPPGQIPSLWRDLEAFTSEDGKYTTGLWEREPDSWPLVRDYDEVSFIIAGRADIELEDGETISIGAGDVFITPKGVKGTWHIHETIVKFYSMYSS